MAAPDQKILSNITVTDLGSEQELCAMLGELGLDPTESAPKWLFRGQVSRRPRRKWPPVDEGSIKKHAFELEELLPTDYRVLEQRLEAGESKAGLEPIYGDRISRIRALTTTYLMQCHSCWGEHQIQKWFNGLTGTDRADKMLSIGQHYGMRTHFLDFSSDWQVALWCGSHDWATGDYIPGGDGVIYQIEIANLRKAEKAASSALCITTPKEMFRHVDIRDTPPMLAPRALAQRGFSLINVESPHLIQAMIKENAIKVLVFPRGARPSPDNSLTKEMIAPPLDEMATLFDECKAGKRWADITHWLAQPGYLQVASDLDHQHLFA